MVLLEQITKPVYIEENVHELSFISFTNIVPEDVAEVILIDVYKFGLLTTDKIQRYLDSGKELYIDSTHEMMEYSVLFKISQLENIRQITYLCIPRKDGYADKLLLLMIQKGLTCVCKQYFADYMNNYAPMYKQAMPVKKFLCLTGKLTAERAYVIALLSSNDLLSLGYVSFFTEQSIEPSFSKTLSIYNTIDSSTFCQDTKNFILSELEKLSLPLTVDVNKLSKYVSHSRQFNGDIYKAVDFVIVLETNGNLSQNEFFITEKTIKCIVANQKFIVVACPHYLKNLKKYYSDNFNTDISELTDWCDTSYDEIDSAEDRIFKVIQIVRDHVINK